MVQFENQLVIHQAIWKIKSLFLSADWWHEMIHK